MTINWFQAAAGALLGLFAGTLFSDLLKNGLAEIYVRVLRPAARPISGDWNTKYWYDTPTGARVERSDRIRLRQLGRRAWGRNEGTSDHRYRMKGQIRNDSFLTGTWDSVKNGVTFHGTFQLWITHDGREMNGKWLGLDDPNIVNHGEWHWTKVS